MGFWVFFALGHKVIVSLAICFLGLPGPASLLRTRYQPFELRGRGICAVHCLPGLGGVACWDKHPSSSSLRWGGGSGKKLLAESLSQGVLELLLLPAPHPGVALLGILLLALP